MINKLHSAEETSVTVDELRHSRTMSTSSLPSAEATKDLADGAVKSDSNGNDLPHDNVLQQNGRTGLHHQSLHPQQPRRLGTTPKPSFMISDILGSASRKRPRSPVYGLCTDNGAFRHGHDTDGVLTSHCDDNKMDDRDDSQLLMSSSDCESSDDGDSHTKGKCPPDCHASSTWLYARLHYAQLVAVDGSWSDWRRTFL